MNELPLFRRTLKKVHPEGIPLVGTWLYNRLSTGSAFQRHYEMVARDICTYPVFTSLLDVGTGPGWLLQKIRGFCPGARLCGLDVSPSMVAKAQANLSGMAPQPEIVLGTASDLPFPDESFEMVVSTGSFHHWKEPEKGLESVFRVLRPGGYALLYDLMADTPKSVYQEAARDFGAFKVLLFWLHAFEEPFYERKAFEELGRTSPFQGGVTHYEGLFCCLELKKPE
ncbi:MAG: class I SAM-dependent methyltransferase [Thermodesulfobacteriota bacterium]